MSYLATKLRGVLSPTAQPSSPREEEVRAALVAVALLTCDWGVGSGLLLQLCQPLLHIPHCSFTAAAGRRRRRRSRDLAAAAHLLARPAAEPDGPRAQLPPLYARPPGARAGRRGGD